MKSHGPIPLLKMGKTTLLEKQINIIKSCFLNYEIIICTGFKAEKLNFFINKNIKENVRIVENQIHNNTNCCESVRLCLNNTRNSSIFIQRADTLFYSENYLSIDYKENSIMTQDSHGISKFETSSIENNRNLQSLCLGLKNNFWVENLYLNDRISINNFSNIISSVDFKTKFLFEAINDFCEKNTVKVYKNSQTEIVKYNNIKTLKGTTYENTNSKLQHH